MNTIQEIANRLIDLVGRREFVQAYEELYSDDAKSIDPLNPDQEVLKGLTALIDREKDFLSRTDIHQIKVSEPIIAGNYFTVSLIMDFTLTDRGKMFVDELCVYKVADGKIISQQFFVG